MWVALGFVGCSPDRPEIDLTGPDHRTAAATCDAIRAFDNRVIDGVNAAARLINDQTPRERADAIMNELTVVDQELVAFNDTVILLPLPAVEGETLRDELLDGVINARSEVADALAEADRARRVPDNAVGARIGHLFIAIEKVMSEMEPAIAAYDRAALRQAFADTPQCRHVVQPGRRVRNG